MDKRDILIRLLKEGHINEEEFKLLYDEPKEVIVKELNPVLGPSPFNPPPWIDPNYTPLPVICEPQVVWLTAGIC